MNEKVNIHESNADIESKLKLVEEKWKVPSTTKREILNFISALAIGKVNIGKKITPRTQSKYISLLRYPLEFFNKPTKQISDKDVEKFDKELTKREYAHSVKIEIRRALKVFIKWELGEEKALKLVGWLDTREKGKTPDYLKESEIELLFKSCKSEEERYLIAVLFDSGARAEEFFNIRYEDIQLPEKNDNFVKIELKEYYSKTKGRTISLYWRYSLEAIKDFLKKREQEGIKTNEVVFNKTYDGTRIFLTRFGKRVLKKRVYFHLFRHSSATYYAPKMNRQELCYRYGWAFSSDMPDVYISRSGMQGKELDEKFTNTELGALKDELEREKQKRKITEEEQKKELDEVKLLLAKVLKKGIKTLGEVETKLK